MSTKKLTILITMISIALFIASLTQKCYCLDDDCGDSIAVFLFGWLGVLVELGDIVTFIADKIQGEATVFNYKMGATFSWLANPLIILSFGLLRSSPKLTLVFSVFSTLLILSFLLFRFVIANEAGHYNEITGYKNGYYLWLASSLTMVAGSIYLTIRLPKAEKDGAH
jgi:hypothetical protein